MHAGCARQLCNADAVAICLIDPSATTVLLLSLDSGSAGSPLCEPHIARLRPPAGWQVRDERGRSRPEPVPDDVLAETPRTTHDQFDALLEARSPMLSRAFRTAGSG